MELPLAKWHCSTYTKEVADRNGAGMSGKSLQNIASIVLLVIILAVAVGSIGAA
jgi:hypothetical protein